jgi:hypothetical protein
MKPLPMIGAQHQDIGTHIAYSQAPYYDKKRGGAMPRLEGERSNTALYILLVLVLLIAALVVLEVTGITNLIQNFGAA